MIQVGTLLGTFQINTYVSGDQDCISLEQLTNGMSLQVGRQMAKTVTVTVYLPNMMLEHRFPALIRIH